MTPNTIRSELDRLISELLNAELVIDSTPHVIDSSPRNIKTVTWSAFRPPDKLLFGTLNEYKWLVQNRQFSVILFDGSILQISYTFQRGDLIRHRLCFYPYPLFLELEEWEMYQEMGFGLIDILENFNLEEFQKHLQLQSPLRFEFDLNNARENHPVSHLHLLRNDCRVPVFAPLSIGNFVQFIFRNFYSEHWNTHESLRDWPQEWCTRTVTDEEIKRVHFNCVQA